MAIYTFKFRAVENITAVGKKVNGVFSRMAKGVKGYKKTVNASSKGVQQLNREVSRFERQQKRSADPAQIRRFGRAISQREKQLARLNGKARTFRQITSRWASTIRLAGRAIIRRERELARLNIKALNFKKIVGGWGQGLQSFRLQAAGLIATIGIAQFARDVKDSLIAFDAVEKVLGNTLKSASLAKGVMNDLSVFADRNGLQVAALTQTYQNLANRGFKPSQIELRRMGDISKAANKEIDQFAEAILDAETAEFERLKEFGIKARKEGEKITFFFKGEMVEASASSAKSIRNALLSFGEVDGVKGTMDALTNSVGGQANRLANQWEKFKVAVGQAFVPVINQVLPVMTTRLSTIADWTNKNKVEVLDWIKALVKTASWGLGVFTVFKGYTIIIGVIAGIKTGFMALRAIAFIIPLAKGIGIAFAVATGPIGLTIAAIAAVGAAIWGITKIFPGFGKALGKFWTGIKDTFSQGLTWLYDNFFKPVFDWISSITGFFDKTPKQSGLGAFPLPTPEPDPAPDGGPDAIGSPLSFLEEAAKQITIPKAPRFPTGASKNTGLGVTSALSNVTENRSPRTINISIAKLVESLNINTTNLTESTPQIREEIIRALMSAVNDVNYAD